MKTFLLPGLFLWVLFYALSAFPSPRRFGENKCSNICPTIFDEVCASNGRTYPNECEMRTVACETGQRLIIRNRGPCIGGNASCDGICTLEDAPVCGSDDETYPNPCAFQVARCKNPDLRLLHHVEDSDNKDIIVSLKHLGRSIRVDRRSEDEADGITRQCSLSHLRVCENEFRWCLQSGGNGGEALATSEDAARSVIHFGTPVGRARSLRADTARYETTDFRHSYGRPHVPWMTGREYRAVRLTAAHAHRNLFLHPMMPLAECSRDLQVGYKLTDFAFLKT
ncbi:unnamed protein product [Darwinula stevensoni]|uniref:Kazal-like domain-containing protein n=1 Tax=Darwinula stevensoni TaxID=69355 RepID=A0A7R9A8E6_9CRUS|nr:unnamed protein product [Darwinula stevensoni]CAG0896270.1 unnamed protein product [Darwinula stevensoni]